MYNSSSESFGLANSPLSALVRTIYETEFRKILKRMPVLLVGGLDVWRKEFGDEETVSEGAGGEVAAEARKVSGHVPGSASISKPPLPIAMPIPISEPSRYWTPPSQDPRDKALSASRKDAVRYSLPARSPADPSHVNGYISSSKSTKQLSRKPAMTRPASNSISSPRPLPEPRVGTPHPTTNGIVPIQYPQHPKAVSPATSGSSSYSSPGPFGHVSLPPQASINPSFSR